MPDRRNWLLASMAPDDFRRLKPHLRRVPLIRGQALHEPGQPVLDVYFPQTGVISLLCVMRDGSVAEAGIVGAEGLVDGAALLGEQTSLMRALVQIDGTAWRLSRAHLAAVADDSSTLNALLRRSAKWLLGQTLQSVAAMRSITSSNAAHGGC